MHKALLTLVLLFGLKISTVAQNATHAIIIASIDKMQEVDYIKNKYELSNSDFKVFQSTISGSKVKYRISVAEYESFDSALSNLNNIKSRFNQPNAWILDIDKNMPVSTYMVESSGSTSGSKSEVNNTKGISTETEPIAKEIDDKEIANLIEKASDKSVDSLINALQAKELKEAKIQNGTNLRTESSSKISQNIEHEIVTFPVHDTLVLLTSKPNQTINNPFSFGFYTETYAGVNDDASDYALSKFNISNSKLNRFSLNMVAIFGKYETQKLRASTVLQFGDVVNTKFGANPFPLIQEANAGVNIARSLWLDAGYFTNFMSNFSFIGLNNDFSLNTVSNYYSSLFVSGARVCYTPIEHLTLRVYLINGYGLYLDNNDRLSQGWNVEYLVKDKLRFNYSGIRGNELENINLKAIKTHHNFNINSDIFEWLNLGAEANFALQNDQFPEKSELFNEGSMLSYNFQAVVKPWQWLNVGLRYENMSDSEAILATKALNIKGMAGNITYRVGNQAFVRIEARRLMNNDKTAGFVDKFGISTVTRNEYFIVFGMKMGN